MDPSNSPTRTATLFTPGFVLLCFATLMFYVSYQVLIPTLPPYVLQMGGGEYHVGLVMSAFPLASVLMRPFAGQWIDAGYKKVLLVCGALVYLSASILYMVTPFLNGLVAVRFLHGLGMGLYSTAASSLTADSAPPSRRGEALGYFMLATSMAMAIGPALGVYVTDHLSYVALFALSAALSLGALLCALPVKQPGRAGGPRVGDADGSDAASGHAIRQSLSSRLKCLVGLEAMFPSVVIFLGSATWGSIASFLALFAESRGIHNSGVFFSAFAVAMFATRLFAGRISDRLGRAHVIIPSFVAVCIGMLLLAAAKSVREVVVSAVFYGMGFSTMQPMITAFTVDHVAPHRRGAAIGTLLAMYDMGTALGGILAGRIAAIASIDAVFWPMAGVAACGLLVFVAGHKRYSARNACGQPGGGTESGKVTEAV
ncbi:MAG: MFS transporter [Firmicutes bacterium]|nr:MFS transporter [Bacillota bacterium]